jgi:hypothetical protein
VEEEEKENEEDGKLKDDKEYDDNDDDEEVDSDEGELDEEVMAIIAKVDSWQKNGGIRSKFVCLIICMWFYLNLSAHFVFCSNLQEQQMVE